MTYRLKQLDLIQSGLCVMFSTFYNLHGHKALLPEKRTQRLFPLVPSSRICAAQLYRSV